MSINIQAKADYSYLFSSMSTSKNSGAAGSSFLIDYAMIKNGSYGKLMKAYYAETGSSAQVKQMASKTNATSQDDTETIAKVKSATDSLKESADKLLAKDSKSVFAQEDMEKVYTAVDEFVKDYNSVLDTMDSVNSTSILGKARSMVQNTAINEKMLGKVGITINEDNSLSVDKDTFMKADTTTVKNLFNGTGSFAYRVSASSSMMNYTAEKEAEKAATYTFSGTYGNTYSSGSIFDSLF